jgi:hypothetical protein
MTPSPQLVNDLLESEKDLQGLVAAISFYKHGQMSVDQFVSIYNEFLEKMQKSRSEMLDYLRVFEHG